MFELMNAIGLGNVKGGPTDKENIPPGESSNPGNANGGLKCTKKKCPHCGKRVFHKPSDCYELEVNKSKWWTN